MATMDHEPLPIQNMHQKILPLKKIINATDMNRGWSPDDKICYFDRHANLF